LGVNRKKVPPHLYDRYGLKARPWPVIVLIAAVGLSLAGYLLTSIGGDIAAGGDVTLITWKETGINEVTVTWAVHRADNQSVTCVLRVQDQDRFDVGYAVARVQSTGTEPMFSSVLTTRGQVFAVPTPVCEPVQPSSSNIPGSHFRPGLLPPAQTGGLAAPWQAEPRWLETFQ
jgi:hypothetical protein